MSPFPHLHKPVEQPQWFLQTLLFLETCCDTVAVENFSGQSTSMGLYTVMADGTTSNGHPVYESPSAGKQLWFRGIGQGWGIGGDYTAGSVGIQNAVGH